MQFGEVFAIINQLIVGFNELRNSVGTSLSDGVLDYNKLGNKPRINGIELYGDRAQAELELEADADTLQAVRDLGAQVDGMTTERQGYVQRIATLETNRTADIARVATLEGEKAARDQDLVNYKTAINTLSQSVSERMNVESRETKRNEESRAQIAAFQSDVSEVRSGLASKADAANTPTTATWQQLKTAMDADVARAEAAIDGMTSNVSFQEVVTRMKTVIDRLNAAVNYLSYDKAGSSCGTTPRLNPQTCIPEVDNTFSFDE